MKPPRRWRAAPGCAPRRGNSSELEDLERLGVGADLADLALARRDQAFLGEISLLAQRLLAGVLGNEFLDARDHLHVLLLHVDEQRARGRVLARGNGLECRR